MNSDNDMAKTLKNDGENTSVTPSTLLLNRRLGTSPTPRMLTPYEIGLLQQSKKEMAQVVSEVFASKEQT